MYIAYCGLKCKECPIFIATATNDDSMKIKLAKEYSTEGCTFNKEDMTCFGCHSEQIKDSKMCGDCKIRNCTNNINIDNCAECSSFPCSLIDTYVPIGSENRETLDRLKIIL